MRKRGFLLLLAAVMLSGCSSQKTAVTETAGAADKTAEEAQAADNKTGQEASAEDGAADQKTDENAGKNADQTVYEIKLGTVWAPEHYFAKGMDRLAAELNEKSGGRLAVETYHNSTLGSEKDLTDGVAMGTVTMSCLGPGQVGNLYAPLLVFDAPYLIQNNDHMQAISKSEICRQIWEDTAKAIGMRPMGSLYLGSRFVTTSKKPVYTPDDLKGLKIRVPDQPISIAEFQAFGANPTPMAYGEVYLALQQNVVDGQENPLVQITTAKFYEVQKYLSSTGHVAQMINPCINEQFYQSLPEDLRTLLTETVERYCIELSLESVESEKETLKQMETEYGMVICEADKAAFQEKVKPVIEKFESEWGEGIYEQLQNIPY